MNESVSFDRAAEFYDRTRGLPESLMARLIPMLAAELSHGEPCLEIGVGTGRIAVPLAHAGVRMVGVDISRAMLLRLREKEATLSVVVADATRLPYPDQTFATVIAAHVLHLIPQWRDAVAELLRVVRPGGRLLATRGGHVSESWERRVSRRFFMEAGNPPWPPGLDGLEALDEHMRALGATVRKLPDMIEQRLSSVTAVLADLEAGLWSACWSLDEETRKRAASAARAWAEQNIGDPDELRDAKHSSTWHAYDLA